MHAIKAGWVRPALALAPSSDLERRKCRIRRSKEERKSLAESFIKKYQKSHNGSFPSLNITHKEVGGSFYTVREIVREIIQENKVLTSPKINFKEHDHHQFLEHPLGSMATDPQNDFSVSDRTHLVNISPNQCGIKSEENFSNSSVQFYEPNALDVKFINGFGNMRNNDGGYDTENHLLLHNRQDANTGENNDGGYDTENHLLLHNRQDANTGETSTLSEQLPQPDTHEFETEIFVSGGQVLEENPVSDEETITKAVHIHDQDKSNIISHTPVQNFDGAETKRFNEEQYFDKNNQTIEKTKEFGQRICTKSVVTKTLNREKEGAEEIEVLCATTSHVNSDVMLETFPFSGRIHDISMESDRFLEVAGNMKDKTRQNDRLTFIGSPSDGVNEKYEYKLPDSTFQLDNEFRDEKMVGNLQDPNVKCPKLSIPFESSDLDVCEVKDLEYEANSAIKHVVSEESLAMERNSSDYATTVWKGSRPLLERINLESWERELKKSSRLESNPLLELVKSYIVAFVKFWSK